MEKQPVQNFKFSKSYFLVKLKELISFYIIWMLLTRKTLFHWLAYVLVAAVF